MGNDLLKQYNLSYEAEMYYFQHNSILRECMRPDEDIPSGLAGVDAEDDENEWRTKEFALPGGDLPIKTQRVDYVGCTQAVIRSINEYFGGSKIKDKDLNDNVGADFRTLVNNLRKANIIRFSAKEFYKNIHFIGLELKRGHPSVATYHDGIRDHTVAINKVRMQQKPNSKGTGFKTRTIIQVMNPHYSTYKNLSEYDFERSTIRLVIPG